MKLRDLKIGTQLQLGVGSILLLVCLLALRVWKQTDQLCEQTSELYNHPFQVRTALGRLEADVESMSRQVRDLFLTRSDQEMLSVLQRYEIRKDDMKRQFAVLEDRYLGPNEDVVALHDACVKWGTIYDETVRLLREGKRAEAETRVRPGGVQDLEVKEVRGCLRRIDKFAINMSDQFYRTATEQNAALNAHLALIIAVILLLSLLAARFLMKGIRTPLKELLDVTEQFLQGKLDVRSRYDSANEFGELASSFNMMVEAIQVQRHIEEADAEIADMMLREEELHAFCHELLKTLLLQTSSQMAAIYLLNDAKDTYEHVESIGLNKGCRAAFSAAEREGEFGAVLVTRKIQHIVEIPEDTRFAFSAVSGDVVPREILTIPVLSEREVVAVISLASIRAYHKPTLRLVNDIWRMLNARMNGLLAFRQIQKLAARLENQNHELEAKKRELAIQADELTEQNTELEMQKRELDEANRLKSAFLSNMSHELRTPLNSVIALSGVLSRRLASVIPDEEYGYLEVIERNGKNLLGLINDILDLSRIEAGREDVFLSRFSVRTLTEEVVAMLHPQATGKGITLVSLVDEELPPLTSDPDKFRHILQNLVANAVKFTEAGSVEISARSADGDLFVSVRDTGIGIAEDQIAHIFDEFRQADDSTSRKYGGTGLGLAIAKKYARLLGGEITVASEWGKGSTFTLRLPLALGMPDTVQPADRVEVYRSVATEPADRACVQGKVILIVEDNEPAIVQLTEILQTEGYRVLTAHNGKEALAQIALTPPDAVVLDLMMPEVDGFHVLGTIREMEQTAQLPVLILTARHVTKQELSFLRGNHIHQLIQKGDINKDGLLAAVARMVAPSPETPAVKPSLRRCPPRSGQPLILLVEDNPDNLRTAKALLNDRYRVLEATDGRDGVAQARAHHPDLILMDIALPVMDGYSALAALREDEALSHIPVIAVTASAMKGNREEILSRGFDGYVSKPIDHDNLEKTLRVFLEKGAADESVGD